MIFRLQVKPFHLAHPIAKILESDATRDVASDACEVSVGSLTGKVALVDRGTCDFTVKVLNAQKAGAIGRPVPGVELRLLAETAALWLRVPFAWATAGIALALRVVFYGFELVVVSTVIQMQMF